MNSKSSMAFGKSGIQGRKVTVLGAARSGLAVAELLARNGAAVFLSEKADVQQKQDAAARLARASIPCEFGGHTPRALEADCIVVSPGLAPSTPVLVEAARLGIPVIAELEAASWFCRAPIVAVTGSNGKSTVTTWIGEMFRASGRPTVVAGNIGQAFSEQAEEIGPDGVAVLEVSSFQLETVHAFRPKVAVFLNLTQDHIDRHGSFEGYGRAKARVFERQTGDDHLVLNGMDRSVTGLARDARARKALFGTDPAGDRCGFVRSGVLILRLDGREEPMVPVDALGIQGEHNVLNALASSLACRVLDAPVDAIRTSLHAFRGLPHRLEFVRELGGVAYVNDSKGTNVDSVWYAIGSFPQPIVLIAGGRDKDSDFTVLRERLRRSVRCAVLIGEAADKMEHAFAGACRTVRAGSLADAVEKARGLAAPGDVVLLSPACASFDMFLNFEDRGDQFKRIVRELA
jgi:UDP-N-acetylmuramoylalanine--D-glutamate ligase